MSRNIRKVPFFPINYDRVTNFARVLHQIVHFFFILNGPEQKMAIQEEIFIFCVLVQYSLAYFHSFIFISFLFSFIHYTICCCSCFLLRTILFFSFVCLGNSRDFQFSLFSCILNSFLLFIFILNANTCKSN